MIEVRAGIGERWHGQELCCIFRSARQRQEHSGAATGSGSGSSVVGQGHFSRTNCFESKGVGDAEWRRALSRESDLILQTEAETSEGAVLVSHWHLPGMPLDSGTPTNWLSELSAKIVHVHCECSAEVSAERFRSPEASIPDIWTRERSHAEIQAHIQEVASLGRLKNWPADRCGHFTKSPTWTLCWGRSCRALRMPYGDD